MFEIFKATALLLLFLYYTSLFVLLMLVFFLLLLMNSCLKVESNFCQFKFVERYYSGTFLFELIEYIHLPYSFPFSFTSPWYCKNIYANSLNFPCTPSLLPNVSVNLLRWFLFFSCLSSFPCNSMHFNWGTALYRLNSIKKKKRFLKVLNKVFREGIIFLYHSYCLVMILVTWCFR